MRSLWWIVLAVAQSVVVAVAGSMHARLTPRILRAAPLARPRLLLPSSRVSRLSASAQGQPSFKASAQGRDAFKEQLRNVAKVSEVFSERHTDLVTRGGITKAKCPFHGDGNERTPSMVINDERGNFYCFACGAKGDVFDAVQQLDGVGFVEAIQTLAERYGLQPAQNGGGGASAALFSPALSAEARERKRQTQLLESAADFFSGALRRRGGGAKVTATECAALVHKRGITPSTAYAFSLGFAPGFGGSPSLTSASTP